MPAKSSPRRMIQPATSVDLQLPVGWQTMVSYQYNHWRIVSQLNICSFRASTLRGKCICRSSQTLPKTDSPPQNASEYRSVTCQHQLISGRTKPASPLLMSRILMWCDPCRASFQQLELQYPFRYYSSISQPHCFSVRLSEILLALPSGPRISVRKLFVSHMSVRRAESVTTERYTIFATYTSTSTTSNDQNTALSASLAVCPLSTRGVTVCMLRSAFGGVIVRNGITCHPCTEGRRNDGCAMETFCTEMVACICIVALYITGRHYGSVLVK